MRRLALLVLGLLAGAVPPARAADVNWQVSLGYSNVVRGNAWTPLFVDISNDGPSQDGQITVPLPLDTSAPVPRYVDYALPVELPRHAKKRYILYLPYRPFDEISLDLSHYREKRAPPRVQMVGSLDMLITVVGGDSGLLAFLSGFRGLGAAGAGLSSASPGGGPDQGQVQVGRLDWSGLPDSWLGWDGVNAVVLGDAGLSAAPGAAIEALRTWVQLGGTLVVPGGALASEFASGPLADLLPADVRGTVVRPDLNELAAWAAKPLPSQPVLAAQLVPRRGTRVLCGTPGQPLIVAGSFGSGHVLQTAFDYTSAPIKYWDGQTVMWSQLLAGAQPQPSPIASAEQADYWGTGPGGLTHAVATMPESQLPSLWLIVGFLLAYIAVLVPVNYTVLNRLGRRELAWLTTPAIVIVFTLGAYGLGYGLRGGSILLNRLGIVETTARASLGRGHGYLGLFSPARTTYQIDLDASASGARDLTADARVSGRSTVIAGARQKITDVSLNMWTSRPFGVEYLADLKGGIDGFMEYDGTQLVAHVYNKTGLKLKQCRLIWSAQQGKSIDLDAGARGQLLFDPARSTGVDSDPYYHSPYSGSPPPSLAERAIASLFGSQYAPPQPPGLSFGHRIEPLLVATTTDLHVPAGLADRKPQLADATVLLVHLPFRLALNRVLTVPVWLIPSRLVAVEGSVSQSGGGGGIQLQQGSAIFEFDLPTAGHAVDVRALTVQTGQTLSGGSGVFDVSVYDFTHHAWTAIPGLAFSSPPQPAPSAGMGMGGGLRGGGRMGGGGGGMAPPPTQGGGRPRLTYRVPRPQDFVSPEGHVQVKVSSSSAQIQFGSVYVAATMRVLP